MVEGCWAVKIEGFRATRLTVGASNDLQMERDLTDGLSVVYQGHSTNLGPFRERFSPAHETRSGRCDGCVRVSDSETDNRENDRMHETNTNANEMHMMT